MNEIRNTISKNYDKSLDNESKFFSNLNKCNVKFFIDGGTFGDFIIVTIETKIFPTNTGANFTHLSFIILSK